MTRRDYIFLAETMRLALECDSLTADERRELRDELLEYCKHDTFAMVKLLEKLQELAEG